MLTWMDIEQLLKMVPGSEVRSGKDRVVVGYNEIIIEIDYYKDEEDGELRRIRLT